MTGKPEVELDFERDWCPRHLEPFRAQWPAGTGVGMIKLFEAFVADPRVPAMLPHDAQGKADAHALQPLILECAPLCCFVGDEAMAKVYAETAQACGIRLEPPA